eukprot:766534-Hanusia_phi.AAC.3
MCQVTRIEAEMIQVKQTGKKEGIIRFGVWEKNPHHEANENQAEKGRRESSCKTNIDEMVTMLGLQIEYCALKQQKILRDSEDEREQGNRILRHEKRSFQSKKSGIYEFSGQLMIAIRFMHS